MVADRFVAFPPKNSTNGEMGDGVKSTTNIGDLLGGFKAISLNEIKLGHVKAQTPPMHTTGPLVKMQARSNAIVRWFVGDDTYDLACTASSLIILVGDKRMRKVDD